MDKKSDILKAVEEMSDRLPYIEESTESPSINKADVDAFFAPPAGVAPEVEDYLAEHATPEEKTSWSIEDFIVEAVHKNADKAIERAKELVNKQPTDIFKKEDREQIMESIEAKREELVQPSSVAEMYGAVEKKTVSEKYDPAKGSRDFDRSLKVMKRELQKHIEAIYKKESVQMLKKIESIGGGGGGGDVEQTNINTADIAALSAGATFSPLISSNHTAIEKLILSGTSGYDVTGAFAGKDADAGAVWTSTGGINYTAEQALNDQVLTFSLDPGIQGRTDGPYWSTPAPEEHVGVGLFGGAYLPNQPLAKTPIFAFSAVDTDTFEDGSNVVTNGRISLSGASYGDQLRVRLDLIVIPQVTNTTVTPMLWYKNATPAGVVTYSFELPTQPVFYGSGTVGKEHLMRVEISAWIANEEDVHALVYPAAKADNPCIFKPNSMMATILR